MDGPRNGPDWVVNMQISVGSLVFFFNFLDLIKDLSIF